MVDSQVTFLPTSKSHGTKIRPNIKYPAPVSFRYCALI